VIEYPNTFKLKFVVCFMVNKYTIGRAVLDEVRKDTANDLSVFSVGTSLIKTLYDLGAISDNQLDEALEQAVFNEAHAAVKMMQKSRSYKVYADHSTASPEYLVYAIKEKGLNWRELRVIRKHLEHKKTLDEFVKTYSPENVIETLKEKVLHPKP